MRRAISSRDRPRSAVRGARVRSASAQRKVGSMATIAATPAAGTPRVPPRKASTASGLEPELRWEIFLAAFRAFARVRPHLETR
uniref:Uncharacterized protein n=1 Tax=Arundo donax TaxID=35708 RepID=A0A0A8Z795_ARUDO